MPLTHGPTGLGPGAYKDNIDYNIFSGEWLIAASKNGTASRMKFGSSGRYTALC